MSAKQSSHTNENLATWFEDMPFGLYRTHVDGTILYVNRATARLLGYDTPEELMQRTAFDVYADPADRESVLRQVENALDDTATFDRLMRRKDGSTIWLRNTMRCIRDEHGNLLYFQGGLQDISGEKERELRLAAQSQHLRTFGDVIGVVDDLAHIEATLTNGLEYLHALIPFQTASIFLFDGNRITHAVGHGFPSKADFQEVTQREDLRQAVLFKRQRMKDEKLAWLVFDPMQEPSWIETPIDQPNRSHIGVALLHQDEVIGLLNMEHAEPGFFTPERAELATVIARQLSLVIVNARLFMRAHQEIQQREEAQHSLMQNLLVSQTLYQVLNHLFETDSVSAALPQLIPIIGMSLQADNIICLIFEPATGNLLHSADTSQTGTLAWEVYHQAVGKPGGRGKMALADLNWPRGQTVTLPDGRQALAAVVFKRGILAALRTADSAPFQDTDHELLVTLANQLTIAVDNEQLYLKLREHTQSLERIVGRRTEQLSLERKRLQAILDATAEGIFYMEDFRIQYANPAFCNMVGYSQEELYGKPLSFIRPKEDNVTQTLNFNHLFSEHSGVEEAIRSETMLKTRSGSTLYASIRYSLIGAPGDKQVRMVAVVRDISQERKLYFQRARFISNAAHELRNPLSSLGLRLHLLRRQPERLSVHLENLEHVTQYLQDLVEELVDLSRFQRGTIQLERSEVTLQDVIWQAIQTNQPFAEDEGVTITAQLPDEPITFYADKMRVLQLVSTLVVNGINYNHPGGEVFVKLRVEADEFGNRSAVLDIEDTGEGIDTHLLPAQIFEPFVRASQGSRKETGMGLALARQITQLHGGIIRAENREEVGARFRVILHLD